MSQPAVFLPKRILVIEDESDMQVLIASLASRLGISATAAMNAAQGVAALRVPPLPDVLVLDLMLPDVNGIDFLKQIRARTIFDPIPVIVVSAVVDPDRIRQALDAGADRYVTKTLLATNLLSVLKDVLRDGRTVRG